MKKIILTGGGTAGHVTPNIALLPLLKNEGFEVEYIGSRNGIEKELITNCGIAYHSISSGKLRRYLSLQNVTDLFRIVKGLGDAVSVVRKVKPHIIFSKGGFVSVPVVIASKLCGVPVVIHESDITPGLANKISIPFAGKVCATFPETMKHLPPDKGVLTGSPIRGELFKGDKRRGLKRCGFSGQKPVLLMMGGSLGSVVINGTLRESLDDLLPHFDIVHLCGRNNLDKGLVRNGYKQFEYISDGLEDILAATDIVMARAGANSICEFLALKKPMLLIPLSKKASRGDQILNAESFHEQGFAEVLPEEELSRARLVDDVKRLYSGRNKYIAAMDKAAAAGGSQRVLDVIMSCVK